ncbi:MAG: hypothetical protein ACI9G1_003433, partial [Pirellulaceae bacterium]
TRQPTATAGCEFGKASGRQDRRELIISAIKWLSIQPLRWCFMSARELTRIQNCPII